MSRKFSIQKKIYKSMFFHQFCEKNLDFQSETDNPCFHRKNFNMLIVFLLNSCDSFIEWSGGAHRSAIIRRFCTMTGVQILLKVR